MGSSFLWDSPSATRWQGWRLRAGFPGIYSRPVPVAGWRGYRGRGECHPPPGCPACLRSGRAGAVSGRRGCPHPERVPAARSQLPHPVSPVAHEAPPDYISSPHLSVRRRPWTGDTQARTCKNLPCRCSFRIVARGPNSLFQVLKALLFAVTNFILSPFMVCRFSFFISSFTCFSFSLLTPDSTDSRME